MHATHIIAIRHGETPWNVDTRIQGQIDIGLNAKGQWQAQRVGHALRDTPIHAVYSSDLERALHTAQAIAQQHTPALSVTTDTRLRERHFGELQGQTWAEIERDWPEHAQRWHARDPQWAPAGGESLQVLRERIAGCVDALASQHLGECMVLVAHGGVLDALYRLATQQSLEAPRTWHLGNAAINHLSWTAQGLKLLSWGDVAHFDDVADLEDPAHLQASPSNAQGAGKASLDLWQSPANKSPLDESTA